MFGAVTFFGPPFAESEQGVIPIQRSVRNTDKGDAVDLPPGGSAISLPDQDAAPTVESDGQRHGTEVQPKALTFSEENCNIKLRLLIYGILTLGIILSLRIICTYCK